MIWLLLVLQPPTNEFLATRLFCETNKLFNDSVVRLLNPITNGMSQVPKHPLCCYCLFFCSLSFFIHQMHTALRSKRTPERVHFDRL